jgi:hypothetical protein
MLAGAAAKENADAKFFLHEGVESVGEDQRRSKTSISALTFQI